MIHFSMGVASSIGRVRKNQEDSSFGTNLRDGIACGVFDGMGGHEKGELAAGLAARWCRDWIKVFPEDVTGTGPGSMFGMLQRAGACLLRELGPGPGTTAVVATFGGGNVSYVWAGDSRLYRFRYSELRQLTHDHARGNVLTRCLGVHRDNLAQLGDPPVDEAYLVGDVYLLCTDGITRELPDVELEARLSIYSRKPTDTQEMARGLVSSADAAGGRDNSTAIVVRVEG